MFPDPFSALGKSMVLQDGMAPGLRDAYIALGALEYDEFEEPEQPDLFKMFGGYVYNPLTLTRILGARMPGASPEMIDKAFFDARDVVPPYEEQPWHVSPTAEAEARRIDGVGDVGHVAARARRRPRAGAVAACQPAGPGGGDRRRAHRAGAVDDSAAAADLRERHAGVVGRLARPRALDAICEGLGDKSLSIRLLAGIDVDSAAPSHAMWDLGRAAAASEVVSDAFAAGPDEVLDRLRASDTAEAP